MKTERKPLFVNVPFDGFYNSLWSGEFDDIEQRECENLANDRQDEDGIAPELRLSESDFADAFYWSSDYSAMYAAAAETIGNAYSDLASEKLGFELGLTFEEMTSPKEYNFETDRLFMSIPRDSVAMLFRMARRDKFEKLEAVIRKRHTSCSGFISFYSNCLGDWLSKPVSTWDHNELGTLLRAYVGELNEDLELYYEATRHDGFYREWESGVDWQKFETLCEEKRQAKLDELLKDEPDYVAPTPRCPFTLDMFRNL